MNYSLVPFTGRNTACGMAFAAGSGQFLCGSRFKLSCATWRHFDVAKGKQRRIELLGGKNRSCGRCFIAGQRTNFGLRLHVHSIVDTVSGRRDRRIEISPLREKRAIQEHSVSFPGDEHPWHFQAGAVHTHRGKRSTTLESF